MPGSKKAQRTKGNVKPSSSSQAAQLLAASGHTATGFIGFSNQPAFVPVSETFDEAESILDGDFRLVLRKLSKRDTVTKIKALQEFASLCSSKDEDVVTAIIPFWPRIYNKVAIDVDHKVRELSQKATAALANRTGKAMAPHLKSIMGMWVVSMCDTYPTVASAANLAFTARFSGAKQSEAIKFCLSEIIECLSKNITSHSKQTLSDPQTTSDEDMESKYQRVVTSSLQGLRKVTVMLPSESVTSLMSSHMKSLLENSAFWKHAKSSVPSVIGGMLSLLSAICQLCPSASFGTVSKIAPFVFSHLDCTDPSIVAYAWEALLSLVSAHEECWQHVSWQKAVWPKLKSVVESGCSGQASIVAPCILPFLSKIPDIPFGRFFESFRQGLTVDNVQSSPSEMNFLVKSLQECMQYAIKQLMIEKRAPEVKEILLDQMLTVVQGSLTEQKASLSKTELFANLGTIVSSTSKMDADVERCFWSDLSAFTIGRLQVEFEIAKNSNGQSPPELFERIKLLLKGLILQESASEMRRKERVKFSSTEEFESTSGALLARLGKGQRNKEKAQLSTYAEVFIGDILVAVFRMSTLDEKAMPHYVSLFSQLVVQDVPVSAVVRLNSRTDGVSVRVMEDLCLESGHDITQCAGKEFINDLMCRLSCNNSDVTGDAEHYKKFVVQNLLPFLFYTENKTFDSEKLWNSTVVSLFTFLMYVDDTSALEILKALLEAFSDPIMICKLLENIILMSDTIPACSKLSETQSFAKHVKQLAVNAGGSGNYNSDTSASYVWKMLKSVISSMGSSKDLQVSQPCLDAIVMSCVSTINQLVEVSHSDADTQNAVLTSLLSLVEALLSKQRILTHPCLRELVISLLQLLLSSKSFEKDEVSNLEQLWIKGFGLTLNSKSDMEIQDLLNQTCLIIKDSLKHTGNILDRFVCFKRVVALFLSSIISPGEENCEENEISSRMNLLSLGSEMEKKDLDMPILSAVADNLLITNSAPVQGFEKVCNYLYINGDLQTIDCDPKSDLYKRIPIETEMISSLHNLFVLEKVLELYQRKTDEEAVADKCDISDAQVISLKNLCGKFVFFSAAKKMELHQSQELSNCFSNLCVGLTEVLNTLTSLQLKKLVDFALSDASSKSNSLEILGLIQMLRIIKKKDQITKKRALEIQIVMLKLKSDFVSNLQIPPAASGEVVNLFDNLGITGDSVCSAFSLIIKELMGSDKLCDNPQIVNQCLSGFLTLTSRYYFLEQAAKLKILQLLMTVVNFFKDKNIHLLNSSDTMPVSPHLLELNVCIARSLKGLMVYSSDQYWEFVLCTLVEWIQFLSENLDMLYSEPHMQALAVSVFELSFTSAHTFSSIHSENNKPSENASNVTEKAKTEWSEFFAEGVFSPLLPMFVSLATSRDKWFPEVWNLVQEPLAAAVSFCPQWLVLAHQLPPHLTASDTSSLSDSLKSLLNHMCPLLMSRKRYVEVSAYLILKTIVGEIAKQDLEGDVAKEVKDEEEEEMKSPPEALVVQIETAGHFLDCLKVVQVDDHIIMDEGTEERSQAMGYLLIWRLLLFLFKSSEGELRAKYAQYFKTKSSVGRLMDHLFRLMPQHPDLALIECDEELTVRRVEENEPNVEIVWLALQVYRGCLEILPALVRSWWLEQDRKSSNFVDRFTTQYLSNGLIWQQITSAQSKDDASVEGITIKTRPATREVLATYEMAEVTVNMTITLPENFPLGKLEVACDKRVGVSQAQWDRWLLQLNIFLQHQNGSIMEGLRLWKGNIDKKFEGLDDCMICFSVIHGTTLQLPRLSCRTCRKKFHSTCLYKWFSTSQKSSCPLCRNTF